MTRAPDFWWRPDWSPTAALLAPFGWIYGQISARRMLSAKGARVEIPVLCIGNFVVGGSGKTPFALRLAERLRVEGRRPGFLLRGYGGNETGPLVVVPERHGAAEVGDEALLLASAGPTIVSADRVAGAKLACSQEIDILLMDDGFQNPSLAKDLNIVLVDCAVGYGNGHCIPAGPLRAPAQLQMRKADVLVLVGTGSAADDAVHLAGRRGLPILHSRLEPQFVDELEGQPLFAFAGIGRPEKFFDMLRSLGLDVRRTRAFDDHHRYSEADAKALLTEAEAQNLQLVTTAKDMARLYGERSEIFRWLEARSETLDVIMTIGDEDRLIAIIQERLRTRSFKQ